MNATTKSKAPLDLARAEYENRLVTWEQWRPVSESVRCVVR